MTRFVRRLASLSLAAALLSAATVAQAEEGLSDKTRVRAEHAIVDGRQQDLPGILQDATTPRDRFPLELDAHWWRRTPAEVAPRDDISDDTLDGRRIAWARAGGTKLPYPVPSGGADEPYPLLTALVEERIRRETVGAAGLPQDSPLRHYLTSVDGGRDDLEGRTIEFCLAMQTRSYIGDEDPAEQARLDKKADLAANLARVLYLGLLGSLLVSAFLATLFVSRDRRHEQEA